MTASIVKHSFTLLQLLLLLKEYWMAMIEHHW